MNAIVQFTDAGKQFHGRWALRGVDLALSKSEISVIVGESDSGNTTLLQLINGVRQPDAGQVRVFDAPIPPTDSYRLRRRIGYAVQGAGLLPHLDAYANVTVLARLEG
jgi:osmoprotectant transport system ATP-binding protein